MKWRRNDPCPCGSGKPYKDCCENRIADFQQHKWLRLAQELQEKLLAFAEEERFTPDSEAAFRLYVEMVSNEIFDTAEEPAYVTFVDWFVHDYPLQVAGGLNLIQCFLKEKQRELGPMEKELLRDWSRSHISLLGVQAIGNGWFVLKDLLAGGEYPIRDMNLAEGMVPGALLLGRLVKIGESYQFSGAVLEFSPRLRDEILEVVEGLFAAWQEENPGNSWREFLKQEGYRLPSIIATFLEEEETAPPRPRQEGEGPGDTERGSEWLDTEELVVQLMEEYYRSWVDLSAPAFAGKTPREMCRTPEGRQEVEALLNDLEELENKKRKAGGVYLDFDKVRTLLGLTPKRGNCRRLPDPSYREVNRLLEENGVDQSWVSGAKRLWHDFYYQARPQVKKATAWAAAVVYTMARLLSEKNITQKELARRYQVAPGTISSHYRTIWETLGLERFDRRYTR